jgi:hypothetical protein
MKIKKKKLSINSAHTEREKSNRREKGKKLRKDELDKCEDSELQK